MAEMVMRMARRDGKGGGGQQLQSLLYVPQIKVNQTNRFVSRALRCIADKNGKTREKPEQKPVNCSFITFVLFNFDFTFNLIRKLNYITADCLVNQLLLPIWSNVYKACDIKPFTGRFYFFFFKRILLLVFVICL